MRYIDTKPNNTELKNYPQHGCGAPRNLPGLKIGYIGWLVTGHSGSKPEGYFAYWNGNGFVNENEEIKDWDGGYIAGDSSGVAILELDNNGHPISVRYPVTKTIYDKNGIFLTGTRQETIGYTYYKPVVTDYLEGGKKVVLADFKKRLGYKNKYQNVN
ncbi:hypothetical protein [Nostoc phage N1]|nr:hypothetical protein [Nostoc phage N1]